VLVAAPAGMGIFFLTHSAGEKTTIESTAAEEASGKVTRGTPPIKGPPMTGEVANIVHRDTPAGPVPAFAPASTDSELQANPALATSPSVAPSDVPGPDAARPAVSSAGVAPSDVVSAPAMPSGNSELEDKVTLAAPPPKAISATGSPPAQKPSTESGFSAAATAALLRRGDELFGTGDVASARLFYERAANAGEARAAMRLGQTFDPIFLDRARLRGVRGDPETALFWYRRAHDLGTSEGAR